MPRIILLVKGEVGGGEPFVSDRIMNGELYIYQGTI